MVGSEHHSQEKCHFPIHVPMAGPDSSPSSTPKYVLLSVEGRVDFI